MHWLAGLLDVTRMPAQHARATTRYCIGYKLKRGQLPLPCTLAWKVALSQPTGSRAPAAQGAVAPLLTLTQKQQAARKEARRGDGQHRQHGQQLAV